MSVNQIEGFYICLDRSQVDFSRKVEIESSCNGVGLTLEWDIDHVYIEQFDCESSASEFESDLLSNFKCKGEDDDKR